MRLWIFITNANHKTPPSSAKLKPVNQLLVYTHHTRPVSLNPNCTMAYHVTFYLAIFWSSYHIGWMDLLKCIDSLFLLKYAAMNLQPVQWEDFLASCCLRDSFCKESEWLWNSTHLLTTRRLLLARPACSTSERVMPSPLLCSHCYYWNVTLYCMIIILKSTSDPQRGTRKQEKQNYGWGWEMIKV